MKLIRLVLCAAIVSAAVAQSPQTSHPGRHAPAAAPTNDGGFTVRAEAVSVPTGQGSMKYGVLVMFSSNDPATVAFVGEVTYRVVGSATEVLHVPAYCMPNFSGIGALYLWVGQATDIAVDAWEVKALGRNATQSK